MKKNILLVLSILLGICCEWISNIVYVKFLPNNQFGDTLGFIFLPLIIFALVSCYLVWRKKGLISIVGLILGFIIGFLLLALGLGLGDR